jgi:two-component system, NarL family, nitrate/nitrite response regulator NarL
MLRVILVGTPEARARLRASLAGSTVRVVSEFDTQAAARTATVDADAVLLALEEPEGRLVEALTPRELEVLSLVAEGLPNKSIAARLGISDQTVKFHVSMIYAKLGAVNRTDAVRRAVRQGLLTL